VNNVVIKNWEDFVLMRNPANCRLNQINFGSDDIPLINDFYLENKKELIKGNDSKFMFSRYNDGPLSFLTNLERKDIESRLQMLDEMSEEEKSETYNYIIFLLRKKSALLSGFKNQEYDVIKIPKGTIFYRYGEFVDISIEGNKQRAFGSFYSDSILKTASQVRDNLAIRRYWPENQNPNSAPENPYYVAMDARYVFKVKESIYMIVGELAYQGEYYTGQTNMLQYYLDYNVALEALELIDYNSLNKQEVVINRILK